MEHPRHKFSKYPRALKLSILGSFMLLILIIINSFKKVYILCDDDAIIVADMLDRDIQLYCSSRRTLWNLVFGDNFC